MWNSGGGGGETERVIIWGWAGVVILGNLLLPIITFIFILLHVNFRYECRGKVSSALFMLTENTQASNSFLE